MRTAFFMFALVFAAALPAAASDKSDAVATVHQFFDHFNKGDLAGATATCASSSVVIDDFSPHLFPAPNGCADWAKGYVAMMAHEKLSAGRVTLSTPSNITITGDHAYIVGAVKFFYKDEHGKPKVLNGSVLTTVLQKSAAGWRITAWAWATTQP